MPGSLSPRRSYNSIPAVRRAWLRRSVRLPHPRPCLHQDSNYCHEMSSEAASAGSSCWACTVSLHLPAAGRFPGPLCDLECDEPLDDGYRSAKAGALHHRFPLSKKLGRISDADLCCRQAPSGDRLVTPNLPEWLGRCLLCDDQQAIAVPDSRLLAALRPLLVAAVAALAAIALLSAARIPHCRRF
jgi:hypothetical protein